MLHGETLLQDEFAADEIHRFALHLACFLAACRSRSLARTRYSQRKIGLRRTNKHTIIIGSKTTYVKLRLNLAAVELHCCKIGKPDLRIQQSCELAFCRDIFGKEILHIGQMQVDIQLHVELHIPEQIIHSAGCTYVGLLGFSIQVFNHSIRGRFPVEIEHKCSFACYIGERIRQALHRALCIGNIEMTAYNRHDGIRIVTSYLGRETHRSICVDILGHSEQSRRYYLQQLAHADGVGAESKISMDLRNEGSITRKRDLA